ncbi:MAG TPA: GGDEF domain-containing protein [Frateuria sp.]|uniref:GGDEF domain-containing protein n=1 Tax=Frateuria sp. TaxID=2211372 RepID=UPI002DF47897|nr:GGDEF domain-containing protein [Frateuria sp.]
MSCANPTRRALFIICTVLALLIVGAAEADVPSDIERALQQAENIKTADNAKFVKIIDSLGHDRASLSTSQLWHLRYLEAWQTAYRGDYHNAAELLTQVIGHAGEFDLKVRAEATLVNILGIGRRYEEAYTNLSRVLDELPQVTSDSTRLQVLAEASQLSIEAGQYGLASVYAERLLAEHPTGQGACKGQYLALHAQYRDQVSPPVGPFIRGANLCAATGEILFANGIRADIAGIYLKHHRPREAEELLRRYYGEVLKTQYQSFISEIDALLAEAYWQMGDTRQARKYALASVVENVKDEYTESRVNAYELLYELERAQNHMGAALAYHEKYMAADKAYLDDVSAKALAYQMVKQQVQARKAEVDALAKRNRILQLQRALDRKAMEASRLYIVVLALGLLAIGLWLLRLKRSQLQFMRMAQCDSLTGIYNRKHFVSEAEHALRYVERSARGASLVLIDLDHFKLINDTYGHAMGDQVLRRAVQACQQYVRSTDVFGRLGGEEFGVLLPECTPDAGIERAEAIRRAIAMLSDQDEPGIPVSASFGVAFTVESGYELRQLLMDADHALYRAKRAGRNCVVAGKQGEGVVVA